ncbi:MAG: HD domain-containing protein [Roseiflexaceae bacterium]|nr:HD domain-containing protein [Roseiflexaceae bacterium]
MTTSSDLALLCEQIAILKLLPRSGWLQRGIALPESIAAHSYGVATLALAVAGLFPELDRGRILALALVHDVGEALLTDLPLTAQNLLGEGVKHEAERRAAEAVLSRLPNGADLVGLWAEYRAGATQEARLIKALDRIELLAQALAYEQAGNRNLAEFWRRWDAGWDEFPQLGELAAELHARR